MEGMLYMSSTCSNDGSYRLTVTFEIGTDLDKAQVLVQNRLAVAQPRLPQEVQRLGVTAQKQVDELPHGRRADLARPPVRRAVPGQLRHAPGEERAQPDPRGGQHATSSAAAGTACGSGSTRRGSRPATSRPRTSWRRSASRTSRSPPARSGQSPAPADPGVPVQRDDPRPPGRSRAVRRHHRQGRRRPTRRRPGSTRVQRRRPRRAGRGGLRPVVRDRRPARGRPGHLAAARRQRAGRRQADPGGHGGAEAGLPRRHGILDPVRHHDRSSRSRSTRSTRHWPRRACWSWSSSCCSSRTGGPS